MTGGENVTIWWGETNFKMMINPESFPIGQEVDILISINHSYQFNVPEGYKIISRTYQVLASEKLQHPVKLTLEHNAVVTTMEVAKSLAIIHFNDNGKVDTLQGYTELNSTNITFYVKELCYVAIIAPENINQTYFLSLFREEISGYHSDPYLNIFLLVSPSFKTDKVCYQRYFKFNKLFSYLLGKGRVCHKEWNQ